MPVKSLTIRFVNVGLTQRVCEEADASALGARDRQVRVFFAPPSISGVFPSSLTLVVCLERIRLRREARPRGPLSKLEAPSHQEVGTAVSIGVLLVAIERESALAR